MDQKKNRYTYTLNRKTVHFGSQRNTLGIDVSGDEKNSSRNVLQPLSWCDQSYNKDIDYSSGMKLWIKKI